MITEAIKKLRSRDKSRCFVSVSIFRDRVRAIVSGKSTPSLYTPEDRINWTPSPSARTPIQLVAHSANSLGFISEMLQGTPYPAKTTADADAEFLVMEQEITSREQAIDLLEGKFEKYVTVLNKIGPEQLETLIEAPFGLGKVPMRTAIGVGTGHTQSHTAQLDYLQTIYGDRNW